MRIWLYSRAAPDRGGAFLLFGSPPTTDVERASATVLLVQGRLLFLLYGYAHLLLRVDDTVGSDHGPFSPGQRLIQPMQIPFIKDGEFKGSVEVETSETCSHPNATTTGETCSAGCCDEYECPDCGKKFMVEVPD